MNRIERISELEQAARGAAQVAAEAAKDRTRRIDGHVVKLSDSGLYVSLDGGQLNIAVEAVRHIAEFIDEMTREIDE